MRGRLTEVKEAYRTSFPLFNVDVLEKIVNFGIEAKKGSKGISIAKPYSCGSSFWFLAPECTQLTACTSNRPVAIYYTGTAITYLPVSPADKTKPVVAPLLLQIVKTFASNEFNHWIRMELKSSIKIKWPVIDAMRSDALLALNEPNDISFWVKRLSFHKRYDQDEEQREQKQEYNGANSNTRVFITPCDRIKAEPHLLGAQIYAKDPTTYTERVAGKAYVIGIQSYTVQEFKDEIKREIEALEKAKGDNKDKIYGLKVEFALRGDEEGPKLYYQSEYSSLSFVQKGLEEDSTLLIERGRKIFEQDQMTGIERKFFAYEECLVYASIYVTEEYDSDETLAQNKLPRKRYQRIHRFEIYLKKDKEDSIANLDKSRLHFIVRMIPDSNEVVIDANVFPSIGGRIPEFRFRDEILVAQIYSDMDRIPEFESQRKEGPKL